MLRCARNDGANGTAALPKFAFQLQTHLLGLAARFARVLLFALRPFE